MTLLRTPLYEAHRRRHARLVEFGGWEMPVQYSSILDEHLCVRRAAGVFDICHMGEVFVRGPAAEAFLNATLTNDARRLAPGLGQYTLMCQPTGGVVDDLYCYRLAAEEFLLVINAGRIAADFAWLREREAAFGRESELALHDASSELGAVAVQGPRVVEFIGQIFPAPSHAGRAGVVVTGLKKNEIGTWRFGDAPVWVGRTGYTGEDGFEVIAPAGVIEAVWEALLAAGHAACAQPCGLGARDTLRTEACFPLYGHELDEQTTPIEAGLGFFVALDKGDFCGRDALAKQKAEGVARRSVAFRMRDKGAPPRPGYPILAGGQAVGAVTSGTQSPTLGIGIGLGYVPPAHAEPGTALEIEIRGRRWPAEVVKKPFYRRAG